ncbi:MAG: hypothetical protein IVW56_03980 [Candidatus Binataceae bacterium]|nr:hypothetical protein [Candidatus Binataceae bacterium]
MIYSTTSIVLTTIALVTALAATDWYVWSHTFAADIRMPRTPRPLKAMELLDGILGRTIRTTEAVLPHTAVEPTVGPAVTVAQATSEDRDGHGFKQVA